MKQRFFLVALAALLTAACGPNREERINQIEDFEDSVFESANVADPATADQLAEMYVAFADKYPSDSLSPIYLLKAGEVMSNTQHTDEAVALFDRIAANYPDFEEVPTCLFLKGNAYEMNAQYDEAREAYQEYLDRYPNHLFSDQVRLMMPRLGMTPEEMLADILAHANDSIIAQE